jgi:tetratricopeptide (TPR) repeat protein
VLRAFIIIAVVGFPVSLVLAWIYDVTEDGVAVQADATDTVVIPFGGRRMDFVVIGVLSVALILSVYMNITGGPDVAEEIEPVSVLIADFDNQTGDPLFDGSLERALQIGIEGASFIAGFERGQARKIAATLQQLDGLDAEVAQLVAAREGIELVLAGSIVPKGERFVIAVDALQPRTGEVIAEADATAASKLEVLTAIGELTNDLREALGDKAVDRTQFEITETFTAMSLEAVREYDLAQSLNYQGKFEQAIEHYRAAVEHDPQFGRAYSGLASSARNLGLLDDAATAWENAMANLGSMTERERLRTQGVYYYGVTQNYEKAIETFETLVEKYPADFVGQNNLAVARFSALDFEGARTSGRDAVEIYPGNAVALSNYALYALYASDFATAADQAQRAQELDPGWFAAWLPTAILAAAAGDLKGARDAYGKMASAGAYGASTANLGLADVELYAGNVEAARNTLVDGIGLDIEGGNKYGTAVKRLALAEALLAGGDAEGALRAARDGIELAKADAILVPAALVRIAAGENDGAAEIADVLGDKLSSQSRAYAGLIRGLIAARSGDTMGAIEMLSDAINTADLWLIRFHLGRLYIEAGYFVEAVDELGAVEGRLGEAAALFLDDLPTFRYTATLPYWLGRAQAELGMADDAAENLAAFVARRPHDPLAADARERLP